MRCSSAFVFAILSGISSGSIAAEQPGATGEPVVVFFAWDRPIIDRDAAAQLDTVAAEVQRFPEVRITLTGHADRSGPEAANLRSARKRAEAVQAYLVSRAVPSTRISIMSFGESRPLIATADGVREPQNRRVEVVVMPAAGPWDATTKNVTSRSAQAVNLIGANGATLGKVWFSETVRGMTITVSASSLAPGLHGIHLHEKGQCGDPAFKGAGAHWNPEAKQHGRDNPQGAHLGDLVNLDVDVDGAAKASFDVAGVTMMSGAAMLADTDGTALVVHAKPDDYRTEPGGASGDRLACAVIAPPK